MCRISAVILVLVGVWQWLQWLGGSGFCQLDFFSYFLDVFVWGVCEQGRHALVRGGGLMILVPIDAPDQRGHFDAGWGVAVAVVVGWQWVYWRGVVL
jgi:hypothetical protein